MATIYINGLRMLAHHGVLQQERRVGNEFEVNITLHLAEPLLAMTSDSLDDTINYAEVVDIVKAEMAVPSKLIEHVAWRIRQAITDRYGDRLTGGRVCVVKLAPPIAAQLSSVSFATEWGA